MALTSNQKNAVVFVAAAAMVGITSALYLGIAGNADHNIALVLRTSARAAFVVLLLVFVARPLRQLWLSPTTAALLRNRRLLGVAFAGIHTAHLALIFYREYAVATFEFTIGESWLGGLTYLVIYLMLITSFDRPARAIGRKSWTILHKAGLYWVFLVFLPTLLPASREQFFGIHGILVILAASAIVIRVTAFVARRRSA